jgi:hypothetical protein
MLPPKHSKTIKLLKKDMKAKKKFKNKKRNALIKKTINVKKTHINFIEKAHDL